MLDQNKQYYVHKTDAGGLVPNLILRSIGVKFDFLRREILTSLYKNWSKICFLFMEIFSCEWLTLNF